MNNLKMVDDRNIRKNRIPLSPKVRYEVLRRDGFTCQYCGRTADERELEIDHIVPYSKGGTNDLGNLQVACRECNRGKMVDDIVNNDCSVQVVEKIVYKDRYVKNDVETPFECDFKKVRDDSELLIREAEECEQNHNLGGAVALRGMAIKKYKEFQQKYGIEKDDGKKELEIKFASEIETAAQRKADKYIDKINSGEITYEDAIAELGVNTLEP